MTKDLETWLESGAHLPKFMRDFHDQKDLFKTIDRRVLNTSADKINWVDAQIYTIDTFLYFMARRGYTLQKSRADVDFRDIEADIEETMSELNSSAINLINMIPVS